jgi:hypothetical protein
VQSIRTRTTSHDLDGRSKKPKQARAKSAKRSKKSNKSRKTKEKPFGPWPSLPSAVWPNRRLIPTSQCPCVASMGSCNNSSRACYGPFHTRDSTCGHDTALPKKSPSPGNEKHDTHSSSVIVEYYRAMPTGMKAVDFEPPTSVLSTLASARLSYSRPLAQVVTC